MKFTYYWTAFTQELFEKMMKGYKEYTDESFQKDYDDILQELQNEALDLAGWGMVLWIKIEEIKKKIKNN